MTLITISAIVKGKVQGVFYRRYTRKKAIELQLCGWVKNNDDGSVELCAQGEKKNVDALIEWLWRGPFRAKVTHVDWHEIPAQSFDAFYIQK